MRPEADQAHNLQLLSDAELIARCAEGDQAAFGPLYGRYRTRLVAVLRSRVGDYALAEDLAQDALVRAMEHLDQFDCSRPFWPWLKTIALRVAVDRFRRDSNIDASVDVADHGVTLDHSDGIADRRLLADAMLDLPVRQREALIFRYGAGASSADAAARMGLTANAFDQLLFRARRNLRVAYLSLDPGTERNRALVLPLFIASVWGKLRERVAHLAGIVCPSAGTLIAIPVLVPVVIVGGALLGPSANAEPTQPRSNHGVAPAQQVAPSLPVVEHSQGRVEMHPAQPPLSPPRSARRARSARSVQDVAAKPAPLPAPELPTEAAAKHPATLETSTRTTRRGTNQEANTRVAAEVAGDRHTTEYKSGSRCDATVRALVCDGERAATGVEQTALHVADDVLPDVATDLGPTSVGQQP